MPLIFYLLMMLEKNISYFLLSPVFLTVSLCGELLVRGLFALMGRRGGSAEAHRRREDEKMQWRSSEKRALRPRTGK